MRIAIATYGEMMSPRFDCASTLRIVDRTGDDTSDSREQLIRLPEGYGPADSLLRQKVNTLLCGGIRRCDYQQLSAEGIEVIAGHYGPYLDVLMQYLAGQLVSQPSWERPWGCWSHGRGRGRQRGGPGLARPADSDAAAGIDSEEQQERGNTMPGRDGKGPDGRGPGTGRGRGGCGQGRGQGRGEGRGQGLGRGQGRGQGQGGRGAGGGPGAGRRQGGQQRGGRRK